MPSASHPLPLYTQLKILQKIGSLSHNKKMTPGNEMLLPNLNLTNKMRISYILSLRRFHS